jgi:hypothetical protein
MKSKAKVASSGIGSDANFDDLSEGMRDQVEESLPLSSRKDKDAHVIK